MGDLFGEQAIILVDPEGFIKYATDDEYADGVARAHEYHKRAGGYYAIHKVGVDFVRSNFGQRIADHFRPKADK